MHNRDEMFLEKNQSQRRDAFDCLHVKDLAIGIAVASGVPVKLGMGGLIE